MALLGWALVLIGWAGWTSSSLPRILCVIYWVGGIVSLFVYQFPDLEEIAALLAVVWGVWQGILLWKSEPGEEEAPEKITSEPR
jgi:hypothetical protein